jgi:hypothetical protein
MWGVPEGVPSAPEHMQLRRAHAGPLRFDIP